MREDIYLIDRNVCCGCLGHEVIKASATIQACTHPRTDISHLKALGVVRAIGAAD